MTLGEKIKQARLAAGLSQRQLCGGEITRNMLSQIENGSARPSMSTLTYFARRLDKPVSWFLEEECIWPDRQAMDDARRAYGQGEYDAAIDALARCKEPFHGEGYLLQALSLMGAAQTAMEQGKGPYALSLLERAGTAGEQTPYFTPAMRREWTLLMYTVQPDKASELAASLPADDRELHMRANAAMAQGAYSKAAAILEGVWQTDAGYHYLRAQAAHGQRDFALAAEHYRQAEASYPKECAAALEECYRELEDYKMAYYYACKQRQ